MAEMPRRKGPIQSDLPKREIDICSRLREMREGLKLTQSEIAELLSISRERLASYEDARAPLKVGFALQLCRQFIISEKWLATGQAPTTFYFSKAVPFTARPARICLSLEDDSIAKSLSKTMLFSKAFDEHLSKSYEIICKKHSGQPRILLDGRDSVQRIMRAFFFTVDRWIDSLEEIKQKRMLFSLMRLWQLLEFELPAQISDPDKMTPVEEIIFEIHANNDAFADDPFSFLQRLAEKIRLTAFTQNGKTSNVKSELEKLIARVKRAASRPGAKSELARFLDVAPARVTEWLSDDREVKREPGGHYALEMLKWVEQQERQK